MLTIGEDSSDTEVDEVVVLVDDEDGSPKKKKKKKKKKEKKKKKNTSETALVQEGLGDPFYFHQGRGKFKKTSLAGFKKQTDVQLAYEIYLQHGTILKEAINEDEVALRHRPALSDTDRDVIKERLRQLAVALQQLGMNFRSKYIHSYNWKKDE
jgi:hypothetical protein